MRFIPSLGNRHIGRLSHRAVAFGSQHPLQGGSLATARPMCCATLASILNEKPDRSVQELPARRPQALGLCQGGIQVTWSYAAGDPYDVRTVEEGIGKVDTRPAIVPHFHSHLQLWEKCSGIKFTPGFGIGILPDIRSFCTPLPNAGTD